MDAIEKDASTAPSFTLRTTSAEETVRAGRLLGPLLRGAVVVSIEGALGSGKTQLCKGLIAGATGITEGAISSPAFTLINEYAWTGRAPIVHIDFYRLNSLSEEDEMMFDEALSGSISAALIEWGDKFADVLAPSHVRVRMTMSYDTPAVCAMTFDAVRATDLEDGILNAWRNACAEF